jgi:hypothetical protein
VSFVRFFYDGPDEYPGTLLGGTWAMKCEGCGAELAEGAKNCSACGRAVGLGHRAADESVKVAKETGAAAEKAGKSLWGGVKSLESKAEKKLKHTDEGQKQG